jgi:hypothetical protein
MELLIYQSKFILFVFWRNKFVGFLRSGLNGSTVCIYTVDQLENVFKSSFLVQKSNESYWLPTSTKQDTEKVQFR